ncbi:MULTISPECIES: PadR family transcriptional regulator [Legionella]|uniref:Transcriptional regulator PadR-like family protein n=1 Tax=Legionella drozanskii LLAP-1 TaxID=1212489 RepID=A0A0W0TC66_9GAMM|nr:MULTISPECIES: PadR family transcriptional regulator [Legionella]KTC93161.1 Transcriptional regulator PadR-like family protein [Legionella drozanskii LLAP-1]PJE14188.1 MAG: PadR family transcriptional regulator [Legionella sp.]
MKERSRTKYTVLGMLALEDLTGYEIIKMIQSSTNYFWSESEGQIYPTLAQCVADGFATCKEEKSEKINRTKKVYSITSLGKKELIYWLKKEPQSALVRNELLLKLFFGGNIDKRDNIHHVVHRQKEIEAEMESYKKLREEIVSEHKNSPHLKYWLITLDCGIKSSKAELAWCQETLKILESE